MFNFWPFATEYSKLTQAINMCNSKAEQNRRDAKKCEINSNEACRYYWCAQENECMANYLLGLRDGFQHGKWFGG